MRSLKLDADISTLPYSLDQSGVSLSHLNVIFFSRFASFFFAFFSKVRSHWLRHAVYHPDAQQGICHWKSGTTTAKVGLESGVPWRKEWNTGTIQTFFMSSFAVSKCNLGKTKLNDMQLIQHMLDMFDMYTRMYLHMATFWIHVCLHVCIDACTTHTNIQNYSSTHMNDKYPLWYYLFTVTYLCIIRKDVLHVCLVYIPCAADPLFVAFCGHKGRRRPSERNVNSKKA